MQLKVFDVFDCEVEKQFLPEPPALLQNTAEGYHKQWTINRRPKALDDLDRQIASFGCNLTPQHLHILRCRQGVLINCDRQKAGIMSSLIIINSQFIYIYLYVCIFKDPMDANVKKMNSQIWRPLLALVLSWTSVPPLILRASLNAAAASRPHKLKFKGKIINLSTVY
jgi:hypothetical protein